METRWLRHAMGCLDGEKKKVTTSVQLNISNPLTGGRARPELARQGMLVEYMDRASGPTGDSFTQNLHTTYTRPAKLTPFHTLR